MQSSLAVDEHDNIYLSTPNTVAVIGAPMQYGQPLVGTEDGPSMLRATGLRDAVTELGWRFEDQGDVPMNPDFLKQLFTPGAASMPSPGNSQNCLLVGKANELLAKQVKDAAQSGHFVLSLGGDHSIGLGTVAGMLSAQYRFKGGIGVVWVDAHADINTPLNSKSGNMHGMPVGMLMRLDGTADTPGFSWLDDVPVLKPSQVAYIGLRDLDLAERKTLLEQRKKGMFVSTMQDVDAVGIGMVVQRALDSLGDDVALHLSYDIDALDPNVAPATGTVVRGGLTFREGTYIAEAVAATKRLVSMDLVEVNEALRHESEQTVTAEMGKTLIASALGKRII
eukprot:CAMPEP_0185749162 /NCGR_PEP_ID=MMETSP1174-20130828/7896_1 /TAXON_ID=35687 /ORGANISM="Dictyocha speculum, Strain CCMP1381" /LENGTH=336 /DNA_ID=CAMNT_0028425165 /DNA_START=149 /DNA_END=1159 /DNA_ORIENTATION=-